MQQSWIHLLFNSIKLINYILKIFLRNVPLEFKRRRQKTTPLKRHRMNIQLPNFFKSKYLCLLCGGIHNLHNGVNHFLVLAEILEFHILQAKVLAKFHHDVGIRNHYSNKITLIGISMYEDFSDLGNCDVYVFDLFWSYIFTLWKLKYILLSINNLEKILNNHNKLP